MSEYTIEKLGHLGDGITPEGHFCAGALPGETVTGTLEDGRLSATRIIAPSPHRRRPPCPHYKSCGGCLVQHADDGFVEAWKQDIVRATLDAQGLPAPIRHIYTSPPQTRRRAEFTIRRVKSGVIVGFHARASGVAVDVPECLLISPGLAAAREVLQAIGMCAASRRGALKAMVTETRTGWDIALRGGKPLDPHLLAALGQVTAETNVARLSWDGEVVVEAAKPLIGLGRAEVPLPPGAFLQATPEGEAALTHAVREICGAAPRVVDLFAGCGTFALPLAESAEVHAVEYGAAMLEALEAGWRHASGLKRVTTETRDLFRDPVTHAELAGFDAAVIDPPRAGAAAQCAEIATSGIARVAMVSCNPVTFARDAARLIGGGYHLDWVDIVDQFRWSSHVELVAQFTQGAS